MHMYKGERGLKCYTLLWLTNVYVRVRTHTHKYTHFDQEIIYDVANYT